MDLEALKPRGEPFPEPVVKVVADDGSHIVSLFEDELSEIVEWAVEHGHAPARPLRVEVYQTVDIDWSARGVTQYRWRVVHTSNGEVMASGEGYAAKADRDHAVQVLFPGVEVVEVEQ